MRYSANYAYLPTILTSSTFPRSPLISAPIGEIRGPHFRIQDNEGSAGGRVAIPGVGAGAGALNWPVSFLITT